MQPAVAWALDQNIRDPYEKLILISLANHADPNNGLLLPSDAANRKGSILRPPNLASKATFACRERPHSFPCQNRFTN